MQIIDISFEMCSAPLYPGSIMPELKKIMSIDKGDTYNLTTISAELHTSTHADAPCHRINGSGDIASVPLDRFIGECHVVEAPCKEISPKQLESMIPASCIRLLIKGNGSAYFAKGCANVLKSRGVITVGTDGLSIDNINDLECSDAHFDLLSNGIAVLENLNLNDVSEGEYFLIAPPIKIKDVDGAFVRAALIKDK